MTNMIDMLNKLEPGELVDSIVVEELKQSIEFLKQDLKKAKKGTSRGVFSFDQEDEIYQLRNMINAHRVVLFWYNHNND